MLKRSITVLFILLIILSSVQAKEEIDWWQFWTDPGIKPTIDSLIKEFETSHPDITINVTDLTWADGQEKIVIAFSAGKAPDLMEIGSDWIAQLAANGYLADLSSHISADSANFQGWGMSTYQNKVYAKPWILGTRVLFGNRDLLAKAGFDSTYIPMNLKLFGDAAYTIQGMGNGIYGWGSNIAEKHRLYKKFLPFFWSNGAQIFTDDDKYCVISSSKAIEALNFYKILNDSCGYVADQRGIEDAFLDGKVGFIISGDWLLKRIELEKRKINLATWLIPGIKYAGKSFLGGEMLVVNEKSSKKEAALAFIDFLTNPENQVRFCKANRSANPSSIVAQKDPYFTSNPHLVTFIKQIKSSLYPPVDPGWPLMEDAIEKAVEDALFGRKLVATALRDAQVAITKIRANEKP
jgi:multiple sugar transport system substrate-binding protein